MAVAAAPASARVFPASPFTKKAAGTTAAAFLKIPHGARYEALGGVSAAASEGAETLFWNPAGLGRLQPEARAEAALSYSALLDGTYAGGAGVALPSVGPGALGVGVTYFSQSAQTAYDAAGDVTGSFAPSDVALSAGYGVPVGQARLGAAVKAIRSSIDDVSGMSVALDGGAQFDHVADVGDGPLDLGVYFSNLGAPLKLGSVASPLPFSVKGGGHWKASPSFGLMMDLVLPVDQEAYVALGGEFSVKAQRFGGALRLGFNQSRTRGIDGLTGLTGGAGLDVGRLRLDYAWVPYGDLGTTNRVLLALRF